MKKYFFGFIFILFILSVYLLSANSKRILFIDPNEIVSIEIFTKSEPIINDSDIQKMTINELDGIVNVLDSLKKIKPDKTAKPLDGDYTIVFNKVGGNKFILAYNKGVITTSDNFIGIVGSDNVLNRLWGDLDYPVQDISEEEFPLLNDLKP